MIGPFSDECLSGSKVVNSRTEPVKPVLQSDQSNPVPSNFTNSTEAGYQPISTLNQTSQSDDVPDPLHVNYYFAMQRASVAWQSLFPMKV